MKFEGTFDLPSLEFIEDEGILKIWGRSIATSAREDFWEPLYYKMEEYLPGPRDLIFSIDLEFFATASARAMMELFKLMERVNQETGRKVLVKWFYDDEEMLEAGEDLMTMVTKLDWKLVDKNEEKIND